MLHPFLLFFSFMPEQLPWQALLAWLLLIGFINSQQRVAIRDPSLPEVSKSWMEISYPTGFAAMLGLLLYYGFTVSWLYASGLFIVIPILMGIIFGLLGIVIPEKLTAFVAFVGWPASAIWFFDVVSRIDPIIR
tara:strand:+ start:17738 stop:18139 length:402 start_codon:yes stop_codon:yes gene_type:complete